MCKTSVFVDMIGILLTQLYQKLERFCTSFYLVFTSISIPFYPFPLCLSAVGGLLAFRFGETQNHDHHFKWWYANSPIRAEY